MRQQVGPFRVERRLGAGGMGEVFLAQHAANGVRCALKVVRAGDEEEVLRFEREGQALQAAGRHPHVVEVLGQGRAEGLWFLALELVEGEDLAARLRSGPLEPSAAAALVARVAAGVAHVHGKGILHRDLKPANVLLDAEGTPKVTDFGLARLEGAETLTQTGELLGTPVYMAPEQARGEVGRYDVRTDVYGLGGVLYACLTGRPPITSRGSLLTTLDAVLNEVPAPPSAHAPEVPAWLDRVCLRALAKSPGERFESASELADALEFGALPAPSRGARPALLGVTLIALAGLLSLSALGSASRREPPASPTPSPAPRASTPAPPTTDGLPIAALRAAHGRLDLDALRRGASAAAEGAEARYRLGDALALGPGWSEGHELLEGLAGEASPWARLARIRVALDDFALGDKKLDADFNEALAEEDPPLRAEAALLHARLVWLHTPGQCAELAAQFEPRDDDVRSLILAAALRARQAPLLSEEQVELARESLAKARQRCSGEPPSDLLEVEGRLAFADPDPAQAMRASFAAAAQSGGPPWLQARRAFFEGRALELAREPLRAQERWRDTRGWSIQAFKGDRLLQTPPPPSKLERSLLELRLQQAHATVARSRISEATRATIATWVESLPAGAREEGRGLLELAARGAPWETLSPRLEAFARGDVERALFAAELALARGAREALSRFAGQVPAGHPSLERVGALCALANVLPARQPSSLSPTGHRLYAALEASSQGRAEAATASLDELGAEDPAWAHRIAHHLRAKCALDLGLESFPPTLAPIRGFCLELELRYRTDLCVQRLGDLEESEKARKEHWRTLEGLAKLVRLVPSPHPRLQACALYLAGPDDPERFECFQPTAALWIKEAITSPIPKNREVMELIQALELVRAGKDPQRAAEVWRRTKHPELKQRLERLFRAAHEKSPSEY